MVIKGNTYEEMTFKQLKIWQKKMAKKPSLANRITKGFQNKVNSLIPERVHSIVTEVIKNIVKAVLTGSGYITAKPLTGASLREREELVRDKLSFYKKAAAVGGAGTGGGGILLGLANLPILISLKIKFLFDVASLYGFDVRDYRERLYILYVFELAFSSQARRNEVYREILDWEDRIKELPAKLDSFDWRSFQLEYRDYIDVAKMLQMIPGIGAVVGAYANYKLMDKLGETAMNAYRLRWF